MKLKVFSVFDSKAEVFQQPFFSLTKGQALRGFTDAANDKNHPMGAHPEDYALFEIGEFDDATGRVEPLKSPVSLGLAIEFVRPA